MDASRHDTTRRAIKKRSNDLFFKNRYLYQTHINELRRNKPETMNSRITITPVVIFSYQK